MFENNHLRTLLGALSLMASGASTSADLDLEPCVNGAVSPSGRFPTAQLERTANGYQTWKDYAPYYLYAVSASYLDSPFEATEEAAEGETTSN